MIIYILIVIVIVIVITALLLSIYAINYNKFQNAIIKISEAEENINILLKKRLELMLRIKNFIEDKKENYKFSGLDKVEKQELNTFELNNELDKYNKKILEITDYDKDIIFDDDEMLVIKELYNLNTECLASERYYNDNVVTYNNLIKCFPSNIIAKICKYKFKDFYSNEKEEIFEILKQ